VRWNYSIIYAWWLLFFRLNAWGDIRNDLLHWYYLSLCIIRYLASALNRTPLHILPQTREHSSAVCCEATCSIRVLTLFFRVGTTATHPGNTKAKIGETTVQPGVKTWLKSYKRKARSSVTRWNRWHGIGTCEIESVGLGINPSYTEQRFHFPLSQRSWNHSVVRETISEPRFSHYYQGCCLASLVWGCALRWVASCEFTSRECVWLQRQRVLCFIWALKWFTVRFPFHVWKRGALLIGNLGEVDSLSSLIEVVFN